MASDPKPVVTGYPAARQTYPGPNTGYPYPAPPPPPHAAPYYAAPPPSGPGYYRPVQPTGLLIRRLLTAAIIVIFLIGTITFIIWLIYRPHLPEFSVTSATVSSFNLSSSSQQLSSDFDVTLAVRNPNKKLAIYYDRVEAAVLYGPDALAETSLPPFYQGKRNETTLRARFVTAAEYVDGDAAKGMTADRARDGVVSFRVRILAVVRFWTGVWRNRRSVMTVKCDNVRIRFTNATTVVGSLMGAPSKCLVDL